MGTRQFVCGIVALAVAMTGAVLLVTDVLFQAATTIVVVVCVAAVFVWLWFGIGLWRKWQR
jgi:threonine/homoserine/homoserine lactone efflux protein